MTEDTPQGIQESEGAEAAARARAELRGVRRSKTTKPVRASLRRDIDDLRVPLDVPRDGVPTRTERPAPGWVQTPEGPWIPGAVRFTRASPAPREWVAVPVGHGLLGDRFDDGTHAWSPLHTAPGVDPDALLAELASHQRSSSRESAGALDESADGVGDKDPLEGLAERITAAGRPELALDPLAIAAAAELRDEDGPAFDVLRRGLKACGVSLTLWSKAVDAHDRQRRRAEKDAAREERRRAALEARAAADARAAAVREAREAERAAARESELAAHYAEELLDGCTYTMSPGRVEQVSEGKDGEPFVRTLALFSAPIVQAIAEHATPDVKPERRVVLSLSTDASAAPRRVELTGDEFDRMLWPARVGAIVGAGPGVRDHLRLALELLSTPEQVTRYGFGGWVQTPAGWRYLTAGEVLGGAPGERGPSVLIEGDAAAYALPAPLEGEALLAGLCTLAGVLSLEPRTVLVPLLGAAFRAPLGPSRCVVHIVGPPQLGKTFAAEWFGRLNGPTVGPVDWNDSSAIGAKRLLAVVGEALVVLDDLKKSGTRADEIMAKKSDDVLRSMFNRTSAPKGLRAGGVRPEPRFRGLAVSTGEVRLSGFSLNTRVATLEMDRCAEGLPAEDLSGVMAAFVQWLAPQMDALRRRSALDALDRAAAERVGLNPRARAAEVFGALALGVEYLARFAAEQGVQIDLAFVREVIAEAAGASLEETAAENLAPRALELLGAGLRSGAGHVKQLRPDGRLNAPDNASAWGWDNDPVAGWRHRGLCVAYLHHAFPGELLLDRGPTVALVRDLGARQGRPLAADEKSLGTALQRAGCLARTDGRNLAVKVSLNGLRPRLLAVRLAAYEDPTAPPGAPPPPPEDGAPPETFDLDG